MSDTAHEVPSERSQFTGIIVIGGRQADTRKRITGITTIHHHTERYTPMANLEEISREEVEIGRCAR